MVCGWMEVWVVFGGYCRPLGKLSSCHNRLTLVYRAVSLQPSSQALHKLRLALDHRPAVQRHSFYRQLPEGKVPCPLHSFVTVQVSRFTFHKPYHYHFVFQDCLSCRVVSFAGSPCISGLNCSTVPVVENTCWLHLEHLDHRFESHGLIATTYNHLPIHTTRLCLCPCLILEFLPRQPRILATMPRNRPAKTGYERLEQADHSSDESDNDFLGQAADSLQDPLAPRYNNISQPRPQPGMISPRPPHGGNSTSRPGGSKSSRGRRPRSNSSVDVKAINARLERWADEIASKFKRGKRGRHGGGGDDDDDEDRLEIHHSVFQAPEGVRPITAEALSRPQEGTMTREEFAVIIESVRLAIEQGVQPLMISQGSSGSYFARNPDGKVVGVFKPKDEEPYAAGNPKWNKWIHRNLFPCCFGRAWCVQV